MGNKRHIYRKIGSLDSSSYLRYLAFMLSDLPSSLLAVFNLSSLRGEAYTSLQIATEPAKISSHSIAAREGIRVPSTFLHRVFIALRDTVLYDRGRLYCYRCTSSSTACDGSRTPMALFPFTREERIQLENERFEAEERLYTMQQVFQWRFERCQKEMMERQKEMMEQFRQYEVAFARQIEELRSLRQREVESREEAVRILREGHEQDMAELRAMESAEAEDANNVPGIGLGTPDSNTFDASLLSGDPDFGDEIPHSGPSHSSGS